MSKNRPINAFIIDDNQDYIDSLVISARKKRIILKSSTNLEIGIDKIKHNKNIDFVILDGKCFVDGDSEKSGQTVKNIPTRAKSQLDDINRDQNRAIGYCVNTGFYDDLHENFEGVFEIFKKDGSDDLLKHIIDTVSGSEVYKIKNKYSECFEVFDSGTIDLKYEPLLIDVLSSLNNNDFRKKNFSTMRDLFEASLLGLIKIGCIPSNFINQHGQPNHEWCTMYLEEREIRLPDTTTYKIPNRVSVPKQIKASVRKLKESLSEHQHVGDNEILKYQFLSNSHLVMEYLIWLSKFHQQYYN